MTSNTHSSHLPVQPRTTATATARFLALALATFALLFSTAACASDSTWFLGDNGKVAVTTFEHRTETGRATEVTLIYGEHFLKGSLVDKDSGRVVLKETSGPAEDRYVFTGTITIDYEKVRITLKGKMTTQDTEVESYNAVIKCKQMGEE